MRVSLLKDEMKEHWKAISLMAIQFYPNDPPLTHTHTHAPPSTASTDTCTISHTPCRHVHPQTPRLAVPVFHSRSLIPLLSPSNIGLIAVAAASMRRLRGATRRGRGYGGSQGEGDASVASVELIAFARTRSWCFITDTQTHMGGWGKGRVGDTESEGERERGSNLPPLRSCSLQAFHTSNIATDIALVLHHLSNTHTHTDLLWRLSLCLWLFFSFLYSITKKTPGSRHVHPPLPQTSFIPFTSSSLRRCPCLCPSFDMDQVCTHSTAWCLMECIIVLYYSVSTESLVSKSKRS